MSSADRTIKDVSVSTEGLTSELRSGDRSRMASKSATVEIRRADTNDRDAILRFIADHGFNPRDAKTWDALEMSAATAWRGRDLVGAIPYEPRRYRGANGTWIARHESVVAVHSDWRNQGIGSQLQRALVDDHTSALTVYREDPTSGAYRWYAANGFTRHTTIDCWFLDPTPAAAPEFQAWRPSEARIPELELHELWEESHRYEQGFLERNDRPLFAWLMVHPYRDRYDFEVVTLSTERALDAYAILGVGAMHSDTTRIDVLDFAYRDAARLDDLIVSVQQHGATRGYRPIRWPIARGDEECTHVATARGFEVQWSFDFLARQSDGAEASGVEPPRTRYFGLDYI